MKTLTAKEARLILKENSMQAKVKTNSYDKIPVLFPTSKNMYNNMLDLFHGKYLISFDMFLMEV
jgi:hypothetical protein